MGIIGVIVGLILLVLFEVCKKKAKFSRKEIKGIRLGLILYMVSPFVNQLVVRIYNNALIANSAVVILSLLSVLILFLLPAIPFVCMLIQMHKMKNTVEKSERRSLKAALACAYFFGVISCSKGAWIGLLASIGVLSVIIEIIGIVSFLPFFLLLCKKREETGFAEIAEEGEERMEQLRKEYPKDMRIFKQYHAFPVLSAVANLGSLLLFLLPMIFGGGTVGWILLGFALGSIALVFIQIFLPFSKRETLAKQMMKAYKKSEDVETSPYYYLYRREFEIVGTAKSPESEAVFLLIAKILFVINYVFYILAAVFSLIFTGIVAVAIGGTCWLLHLICKTVGGGNNFAILFLNIYKLAVEPLKWSFKLAKSVFTFQLLRGIKTDASVSATYRSNEQAMSAGEAELHIDQYMSVSYSLPTGTRWGSESLECRGSDVYFSGVIEADSNQYDESRLNSLVNQATREIRSTLDGQAKEFLRAYPQARRANVRVSVEGKLY